MREGIFFVVSAPSGTGKTTLCAEVLKRVGNLKFTVSYTTRQPRANEKNGREYHFISAEEFQSMVERNAFAEHANVYGNQYGTSVEELETQRAAGCDLLIEIDVQGAMALKVRYPRSVLIFIHPPSFDELRSRLTSRATDSAEVIAKRLSIAGDELALMHEYHYLIENRILDDAIAAMTSIIVAERHRSERVLPEVADRFPRT